MKNIKHLRDLEDLPSESLSFKNKPHERRRWWSRKSWRSPGYEGRVGDYSIWKFSERIIENNIGKSFDTTFSYFCKYVPKYAQHIFLQQFSEERYSRRGIDYFIDENGNIQRHYREKWKNPNRLIFFSDDYYTGIRHILTGHPYPYDWEIRKLGWKFNKDDYQLVILKGWSKTFETRNDREFTRLRAEKQKMRDRRYKKSKKNNRENSEWIYYAAIEYDRKKQKEEKEKNLIKIQRHGFDEKESFRNPRARLKKFQKALLEIDPRSVSGNVGE